MRSHQFPPLSKHSPWRLPILWLATAAVLAVLSAGLMYVVKLQAEWAVERQARLEVEAKQVSVAEYVEATFKDRQKRAIFCAK